MQITTNNRTRQLVSYLDLPEDERQDFDYICPAEYRTRRFVKAYGQYFDVSDSTRTCDSLSPWDGMCVTSAFTAVLFRYTPDFDSVVCAWGQS